MADHLQYVSVDYTAMPLGCVNQQYTGFMYVLIHCADL